MINPFYSITTFEGDADFEDYLRQLQLFDIFKEIFIEYQDKGTCVGIIKFIAWAYGLDSDMLSSNGNSWAKVSRDIFNKTELHKSFYEDLVLLQSESVKSAIEKFLTYQNDENWTNYCTFRDLRFQMLSSATGDIKTANGTEINYEQKMKNAIHSITLLQMMNDAKETFIQNHPKLKASVEAFNKASEKTKVTRSVSNYAQ